jgi:hypothetical protein
MSQSITNCLYAAWTRTRTASILLSPSLAATARFSKWAPSAGLCVAGLGGILVSQMKIERLDPMGA